MMRLQKILAQAGVASRRSAEKMIAAGRVTVNGKKVKTLGTQADPETDTIFVDGSPIRKTSQQHRYVVLHKPTGYVSTKARFKNQKSVYDLVPESRGLALAGRLDKDSSGLLLFSDDGGLIYQLTHPSFTHRKVYDVLVAVPLNKEQMAKLKKGVWLSEGKAAFDSVRQIGPSRYRVTMHQGWKRQIRRMMQAIDAEVRVLQRVQLAGLRLGNLPAGKWRTTTKKEILASS